jgi:Cu/Ag efflux protein CusF
MGGKPQSDKEERMKKHIAACISLVAVLSFGAGAYAADEKKVERSQAVTITATVDAVDQATRMVTLKTPEGKLVSFVADAAVKNLAQVKAGDKVTVKYYESLVMRVLKPEEASVNQASAGAAAAKPGEKPAALGAKEVIVTVTIEGIDKAKGTVTFKGPAGNVNTIRAEDPKNLEKIKVGDRVAIAYTQALAIAVEKAK